MSETNPPSFNYANALAPGSAEQGFQVEMLPAPPEKTPIERVLANYEEVPNSFLNRYHTGDGVRLLGDIEQAAPGETEAVLHGTVDITTSQYEQTPDLPPLREGPKTHSIPSEKAAEVGLSHRFPEEEALTTDRVLRQAASAYSDADYLSIEPEILSKLDSVTQVFELSSGDKMVRLYNFSDTLINQEQISQLTNGLRHISDLTGGAIFDKLHVTAILPEGMWQNEQGENMKTNATTYGKKGVVTLNERMFKNGWNEWSQNLQPADAPYAVGGGAEGTYVHELHHILTRSGHDETQRAFGEAVGWKYIPGEKNTMTHQHHGQHEHPFRYGRTEPEEDLPETGAARHLGGEWEASLDDERRQAIEDFWAAHHSGIEGPTFVAAREVDIHALPQKIGTNLRNPVAFRTKYNYSVVPDVAAA